MVEINRRQLLKGAGLAAILGGGGALASSAFDDSESTIPYDGVFYSDHYALKNPNTDIYNAGRNALNGFFSEPVHSIIANRGIRQIGYSSPSGEVSHGICDATDDGYVEHRFVATHLSLGVAENMDGGGTGIPANKRAKIVLDSLGPNDVDWLKGDSVETCGRMQITPNYRAISKFPIDDLLEYEQARTNPYRQLRRMESDINSNGDLNTGFDKLKTGSAILASGLGFLNIGATAVGAGGTLLGLFSGPVAAVLITAGGLGVTIWNLIDYKEDFVFEEDTIKAEGIKANTAGLFYTVDFTVRVPPNTQGGVEVSQLYKWDPDDIAVPLPTPIPPKRTTRINIPEIPAGTSPEDATLPEFLEHGEDLVTDDDGEDDGNSLLGIGDDSETATPERYTDSADYEPDPGGDTPDFRRVGIAGTDTVNTDVLAALDLDARVFQTDVGDVNWSQLDSIVGDSVTRSALAGVVTGGAGIASLGSAQAAQSLVEAFRSGRLTDPKHPIFLDADVSMAVVDDDTQTATEKPLPIQWRIRHGTDSHDDVYHGTIGVDSIEELVEFMKRSGGEALDASIGDLDGEIIGDVLSLGLASTIAAPLVGGRPSFGFRLPDSLNGVLPQPLFLSETVGEGFYTIETTVRNRDGRTDTIEKDVAVDKDALPIIDYPEPLPVERPVQFDSWITGPEAERIRGYTREHDGENWIWTFKPADDYDKAADPKTSHGRSPEVTFDVAVPYELELRIEYGGDNAIERTFELYPKAAGPVPHIHVDQRPVPAGEEVEITARCNTGDGDPEPINRTWRIETVDDRGGVESEGGEWEESKQRTFYQQPYRIVVDYEFEDPQEGPFQLRAQETIHPEVPPGTQLMDVRVEDYDGDPDAIARLDAKSSTDFEAYFPGYDDTDGLPRGVKERIPEDVRDVGAYIGWRVEDRETGETILWNAGRDRLGYTFQDRGRYRVTALLFPEDAPNDEPTGGHVLEASRDVVVGGGNVTANIRGPDSVPPDVEVDLSAQVYGVEDGEDPTYAWTIEPDGRKPIEKYGRTITHAFNEGETRVALEVYLTEGGDPDAVAERTVETDAAAVTIEGPREVSTDVEQTFTAALGPAISEADVYDYEWSVEPATTDQEVPKGPDDSAGAKAAVTFSALGAYRIALEVEVDAPVVDDADGDRATRTAVHDVVATHAPATLEFGIEPPTDCRADDVSDTLLSTEELQIDAPGVDQFGDGLTARQAPDSDHNPRESQARAAMYGLLVGRTAEPYEGPLMTSHKCEHPVIRYHFSEVPEDVTVDMTYAVDTRGRAAQPYVRALTDGTEVDRVDLATVDGKRNTDSFEKTFWD